MVNPGLRPETSQGPDTLAPDDFLVSETRIHRRYLQIPRDQQALLKHDGAWFVRGHPHLPPDVLEGVKLHHQRLQAVAADEHLDSRIGTSPISTPEPPSLQRQTRVRNDYSSSPPTRSSGHGSPEIDGDAASSDWVPTPDRGNRVAGEPSHPFPVPELASPQMPTAAEQVAKLRNVSDFMMSLPSSSPEPDVAESPRLPSKEPEHGSERTKPLGLSTSLPGPQGLVARGAQLFALPQPTPPSAQLPVIPSTDEETVSPVKEVRKQPKWRTLPADSPPSMPPRKSAMAPPPTIHRSSIREVEIASSGESSSLPGGKSQETNNQGASSSQQLPTSQGASLEIATPQESRIEKAKSAATDTSSQLIAPPPNGPPSQVPFTAFKIAYPDYVGREKDFVTAITYIKWLQQQMALAEFLYDDFIGVWTDYLSYASESDGEETLPAIKWYNKTIRRPKFIDGVVTNANLKEIVDHYSEQVEKLHQDRRASGSGDPVPNDLVLSIAPMSEGILVHDPIIDDVLDVTDSTEDIAQEHHTPPQPLPTIPDVDVKVEPAGESQPPSPIVIRSTAEPSKDGSFTTRQEFSQQTSSRTMAQLTQPTSTALSGQAEAERLPETVIRPPLGSPRSSFGPTQSTAPSSSLKRKRREHETPEQRRASLMKVWARKDKRKSQSSEKGS